MLYAVIFLSIACVLEAVWISRIGDRMVDAIRENCYLRSRHRIEVKMLQKRIALLTARNDQLEAERKSTGGHGWGC